ncbi:uncharacterized protein RSE6_03562 [Rhynchosporium secalis]|uniref:Uncharacterized protein n=1 Tax=Rhynchosporium secalis TaxID=38038 RepID=A0A1E1M330_RHYSE|nr:uncharacterized protein RSE6_03562 [Rhynchosporium secalis]
MSSTDDPKLKSPPLRSVEKESSAFSTIDNGAPKKKVVEVTKAKANTIPYNTRSSLKVEIKQNLNTESEASTIVPRSSNELSNPASRGSPPAEENYKGFRPPINDAKGYYANARRQVYGSSSPPQPGRSPAYGSSSPSYVPRSRTVRRDLFHGYSGGREDNTPKPRRAVGGYTGLEDDDEMDIDDELPPPTNFPVPQNKTLNVGSSSPAPAAPWGRTTQRTSVRGRGKFPSSDPYVGFDHDMDSYYGEDNRSDYGGSEELNYRQKSTPLRNLRESRNEEVVTNNDRYINRFDDERSSQRPRIEDPDFRRPSSTDYDNGKRRRQIQAPFRRATEDTETDNESSMFVPERTRLPESPSFQTTPASSDFGTPRPLFSHDTFISAPPIRSTPSSNKRRKVTDESPRSRFNNPGAGLDPSRYSGDPNLNWGLNQDPPSVPQSSVSDAALLKRGLTRGAKEKVCKRGYGANDPENVNIVNMKEDGMAFSEIVDQLNEVRVANGRNPSLSVCGVTSRYNRTAPLLFAAEGRQFIPLSKRGKNDLLSDGPVGEKPVWDDDLDLVLAQVAKDIDKEKWGRVAKEFNRRTGKTISAAAAALRHTIL